MAAVNLQAIADVICGALAPYMDAPLHNKAYLAAAQEAIDEYKIQTGALKQTTILNRWLRRKRVRI
jgi:hypothetical protein